MGRHIRVAELLPIGREFGVSLLPPRLLLTAGFVYFSSMDRAVLTPIGDIPGRKIPKSPQRISPDRPRTGPDAPDSPDSGHWSANRRKVPTHKLAHHLRPREG